jgi:hypothetical protein
MKQNCAALALCGLSLLSACGGGGYTAPSQPQSQPLIVTSGIPVGGTVGVAYGNGGNGFQLTASGGPRPMRGSGHPSPAQPCLQGLNLSSNVISGTPSAAGSFSVTVTVTDSASPAAHTSMN